MSTFVAVARSAEDEQACLDRGSVLIDGREGSPTRDAKGEGRRTLLPEEPYESQEAISELIDSLNASQPPPPRAPTPACAPQGGGDLGPGYMISNGRVGYGAAACGADILFHETLIEFGGESHVVLPFNPADFEQQSVEIVPGWSSATSAHWRTPRQSSAPQGSRSKTASRTGARI